MPLFLKKVRGIMPLFLKKVRGINLTMQFKALFFIHPTKSDFFYSKISLFDFFHYLCIK